MPYNASDIHRVCKLVMYSTPSLRLLLRSGTVHLSRLCSESVYITINIQVYKHGCK